MPSRPIRIAGASGSASDRRQAILSFARNHPNDPVDLIIGDWMSEGNMTHRAWSKTQADPADLAYEPTFLEAIVPALPLLDKHRIKVAVNAGASDPKGLCDVIKKLVKDQGLKLSVAWVDGDEVFPAIQKRIASGEEKFENICTGEQLSDWKFEPIYAQAYLGGLGIAEALRRGSDIVICGRVSDASPVIGGAYWWHNWKRSDLGQLANTFVAGHLIVSYDNCGKFDILIFRLRNVVHTSPEAISQVSRHLKLRAGMISVTLSPKSQLLERSLSRSRKERRAW
jgi:hypothetical protein